MPPRNITPWPTRRPLERSEARGSRSQLHRSLAGVSVDVFSLLHVSGEANLPTTSGITFSDVTYSIEPDRSHPSLPSSYAAHLDEATPGTVRVSVASLLIPTTGNLQGTGSINLGFFFGRVSYPFSSSFVAEVLVDVEARLDSTPSLHTERSGGADGELSVESSVVALESAHVTMRSRSVDASLASFTVGSVSLGTALVAPFEALLEEEITKQIEAELEGIAAAATEILRGAVRYRIPSRVEYHDSQLQVPELTVHAIASSDKVEYACAVPLGVSPHSLRSIPTSLDVELHKLNVSAALKVPVNCRVSAEVGLEARFDHDAFGSRSLRHAVNISATGNATIATDVELRTPMPDLVLNDDGSLSGSVGVVDVSIGAALTRATVDGVRLSGSHGQLDVFTLASQWGEPGRQVQSALDDSLSVESLNGLLQPMLVGPLAELAERAELAALEMSTREDFDDVGGCYLRAIHFLARGVDKESILDFALRVRTWAVGVVIVLALAVISLLLLLILLLLCLARSCRREHPVTATAGTHPSMVHVHLDVSASSASAASASSSASSSTTHDVHDVVPVGSGPVTYDKHKA